MRAREKLSEGITSNRRNFYLERKEKEARLLWKGKRRRRSMGLEVKERVRIEEQGLDVLEGSGKNEQSDRLLVRHLCSGSPFQSPAVANPDSQGSTCRVPVGRCRSAKRW
ncbi:hypothetical protein M407DRAFT_154398 [Tulasnella calospora MUT 4182]|uniref:Uncharacterized protein n=1 Tax=Tulasnella calospora MUT 4182 TaxID=1051891 RepID=A0A0C3PVD4_9AGAM|nr:hypothetical protein M407DRAFT_154398 [Tulasnella calospora MUT 4182]